MKRNQVLPLTLTVSLFIAIGITSARATSLLLDFGPTSITNTVDATHSPGHALNVIPSGELTWNTLQADTNTLYYGDGTPATGVTLDLGRSGVANKTIDFNDNGFNGTLIGTAIKGGIYTNSSPMRDGLFGGGTASSNIAAGLRISGLAAGTYTIYVVGRNSNTGNAAPERFYATNAPSATTYAYSLSSSNVLLANSAPPITNAIAEGDNFATLTITLAAGQSLLIGCEGTTATELRGFINCIEVYFGVPVVAPHIATQPANRTVMEGAYATFTAGSTGTQPITNQWRFNGTNLTEGANVIGTQSNMLVLHNVTASMGGPYSLAITNVAGHDVSSNANLAVSPAQNTDQMSNIWNIIAGDRIYVPTSGSTERWLAYNPLTTNLLLVSRNPSESVVVLDAQTGAEKYFLNVSGVPTTTPGISFGINTIGVADDGAVYSPGLTISATSPPLNIFRWPDDSSNNAPVLVFAGDPGLGVQPNLRWGDNMAIRGAGSGTEILMAPGSGTNVVLLRTISSMDFQTEIPPAVISVRGVPSAFAQLGIAFGPGTNTFWAKTQNNQLFLIQYDLNSLTGGVLYSYSAAFVAGSVRGIAASADQKFLAAVAVEAPNDNVRIYDIFNPATGVLPRDQEPFFTQNANNTGIGGTAATAIGGGYVFALDSNNGLKGFLLNTNYTPPSVSILTQPASRTVYAGAMATFTALVAGNPPIYYQWRFNGTNLTDGPNVNGSTNTTLTLVNVATNSAGNYSLFVSNNFFATATSSNALLTVVPIPNTTQMSNVWNLLPGDRNYLGTNGTERGIAYNQTTTNLLLVSRNPSESVVVLNPLTGTEKRFLDVTGIPGSTAGVSLGLSQIGISDDGVIYAAGLTVSATSPPYYIYRWPDDAGGSQPVTVFAGDPAVAVQPNLRWGDNFCVRGSGPNTQILIAPGSGTNVVLLQTVSTMDFQTEVPPVVISVSGVASGFAQVGLAFGPAANTFWAKAGNSSLYLIGFDLNASTGAVLYAYSTARVPSSLRGISVNPPQKYLAGLAIETPNDNVRLFDVSNLSIGPIQRDEEVFATSYPNITINGTGMTAFGGNYLFALDSNNGLKAFLINTNFVPPQPAFSITNFTVNPSADVLTWPATFGVTYQVQFKDSLTDSNWTDIGNQVIATSSPLSFTNNAGTASRCFRVRAQ
jgi:hypothetical protein